MEENKVVYIAGSEDTSTNEQTSEENVESQFYSDDMSAHDAEQPINFQSVNSIDGVVIKSEHAPEQPTSEKKKNDNDEPTYIVESNKGGGQKSRRSSTSSVSSRTSSVDSVDILKDPRYLSYAILQILKSINENLTLLNKNLSKN